MNENTFFAIALAFVVAMLMLMTIKSLMSL
jgi:hypothetical protein